ncbi:hypothetical protein BR93DRAFT_925724 [Coniochaeta sp. PMI_546]|nr:hypothetical protein BR93DRAFT_925724 [Coniochaeta sp. PMI_546]
MWRPDGSQNVDVAGPRLKARLEDWIKRYTMAMIQSSELAVKTKDANLKTAYRADQVLFSTLADAARAWANEVDAGQWVDDPHMGSDERDGLMFQMRSYQEEYKKTVGGLDGKVEVARRAWEAVKDGQGSMTTGSLGVGESISIVKKGWLSGGDELPKNDSSD